MKYICTKLGFFFYILNRWHFIFNFFQPLTALFYYANNFVILAKFLVLEFFISRSGAAMLLFINNYFSFNPCKSGLPRFTGEIRG